MSEVVYVSVPGVSKEDVSVKVYRDGRVVIKAENDEFSYRKVFWLADGYDIDKVEYVNGMLKIYITESKDFAREVEVQ